MGSGAGGYAPSWLPTPMIQEELWNRIYDVMSQFLSVIFTAIITQTRRVQF